MSGKLELTLIRVWNSFQKSWKLIEYGRKQPINIGKYLQPPNNMFFRELFEMTQEYILKTSFFEIATWVAEHQKVNKWDKK